MSAIVHVRHPVPVRYYPKRARTLYRSFLGVTTPVTLREAEGFQALASVHADHFFAHEGRVWVRLNGPRDNGRGETALGRADLVRLLTGEDEATPYLARAFARTPLRAENDLGAHECARRVEDAVSTLAAARAVVEDDTAFAVAALRRFVEEDLRLCGDAVFLRAGGPLAAHAGGTVSPRFALEAFPRSLREHGLMTRIDRLEEFWAFEGSSLRAYALGAYGRDVRPTVVGLDAPIPSALLEDDDVRVVANCLPGMVLDALDLAVRATNPARIPDAIMAGLDSLRTWKARGALGAVGLDRAEEVLLLCRDVFAAAQDAFAVGAGAVERLRVPLLYVDRIALPRLRDTVLDPDDAAALSGVAP